MNKMLVSTNLACYHPPAPPRKFYVVSEHGIELYEGGYEASGSGFGPKYGRFGPQPSILDIIFEAIDQLRLGSQANWWPDYTPFPVGAAPLHGPGRTRRPVPVTEPAESLPVVLQPTAARGESEVLGEADSVSTVQVDPNNPGKYIITTDTGQVLANTTARFVAQVLGEGNLPISFVPDPQFIPVEDEEDEDLAGFDLGDFVEDIGRAIIPDLLEKALGLGPNGGKPAGPITLQPSAPSGGYAGPKLVAKRRCRRRRRKLLTDGDFNALLKIQTLKNTDTMKIAISKALR